MAEASDKAARALEGGSYEVIRQRLLVQAEELGKRAGALNERRKALFGGGELLLAATDRVRTENNAVPRDAVSVAGGLLFGFHVFLGLKTETNVADILSLYKFAKTDAGYDLSQLPLDHAGGFLQDPEFEKQFRDAFRYSKEARLLQLVRQETRLLVALQIGATLRDIKVFRFAIDGRGTLSFIDARGEEEYAPPRAHSFAWKATTREDQVPGRYPHINVGNELFVETVGGDLTIKIENNTQDGYGIYREPVDDPNQTLDDAEIAYAKVAGLVLLKIKPFRETTTRYLVYNPRTAHVLRLDAIGAACMELPESHGIIFPGGYYLASGEHRLFDTGMLDIEYESTLPSPNGEDVLYVFYRPEAGEYVLLAYNLIAKEVKNSIRCHGYSLFPDGTMLLFRESAEATRIHPVQIWNTPFTSSEFSASAPTDGSYLAKVGNRDLVTGISEILSLKRLAETHAPTRRTFEELAQSSRRTLDAHHWLGHEEVDLLGTLTELRKTSELVIDEFEKVLQLERAAKDALAKAEADQKSLLDRLRPSELKSVEAYLNGLSEIKRKRGSLSTLKELRSIDVGRIGQLEAELEQRFTEVSRACLDFFLAENAFAPLLTRLDELITSAQAASKTTELGPLRKTLDEVHEGLTLLSETISGLPIDDPTVRTKILDGTSSAFAHQNRARAVLDAKHKELASGEGRAEFGVQFKLLGQSVTSALALANTPEACDEQLGRLLLALEGLESRFSDLPEFSAQLADKREEVLDAVAAKRQQLVEERQRRAQSLATAAQRILAGIERRALTLESTEELHAYFASDPMVHKLGELSAKLRELGDAVRADELESKLKSERQNAIRALRDQTDLLEDDGQVIRFGQHRFSVNKRPLELVIVPRDEKLNLHLTGTDFFETISSDALEQMRDLWEQDLVSESKEVYRGEFLAVSILRDADSGVAGAPTHAELEHAVREERLVEVVRGLAAQRIDEGYENGVHDADATLILTQLLELGKHAGMLRYSPAARAASWLYWQSLALDKRDLLERRARSAGRLRERLADPSAEHDLGCELGALLAPRLRELGVEIAPALARVAARSLVSQVATGGAFTLSPECVELHKAFFAHLQESGARSGFEEDLRLMAAHQAERYELTLAYVDAFLRRIKQPDSRFRLELVARLICDNELEFTAGSGRAQTEVKGLLGAHARIVAQTLPLDLSEVLERVTAFIEERSERFRAYRSLRTQLAAKERERLRLSEFLPRVLTSFVRNRLVDEVYLPLVGANLAKQLGAAGAAKRTDQMGLLLLVSPPGYGKTTLMEYVASKLGLVFMKVNGPALGTEVRSLDPSEAPNATARQEVEKLNLALEMGNNVMLYLDDIQHTHPELLQKFISLCDAQRRIEGVWNGRTRTYDLRGKRFCIAMAGNPYTESGARFQIPDMLANRADTYNLGDILEGKYDAFALSYIENALTSNRLLAPLAGRDPKDVHKLIAMARGEPVELSSLSHGYSSAEVQELIALVQRMFKVQAVLLRVNQEYIASASQDDRFRTEPPFKLQGSYRNMNKLVEKLVPVMNDAELERLVDDHYTGESQTLTKGAEQNLLKLGELRGRLNEAEKARWSEIKESFLRVQRMGGSGDDPVARVTGTLSGLDVQLQGIRDVLSGFAAMQQDAARRDLAQREEQAAQQQAALELREKSSRPKDATSEQSASLIAALTQLTHKFGEASRPPLEVTLTHERNSELVGLSNNLTTLLREALARIDGANQGDLGARVAGLEALLQGHAERAAQGPTHSRRIELTLGSDGSNFYRPQHARDLCSAGGLFVATYDEPPPLGAEVLVVLRFPNAASCEFVGRVDWLHQDGDGVSTGFGVRFVAVEVSARALIEAFARLRPPLLRED